MGVRIGSFAGLSVQWTNSSASLVHSLSSSLLFCLYRAQLHFVGVQVDIIDIQKLISYSVEVVFPYNFPPTHPTSRYTALFYCLWHATMIFYHYYCAITVSPGFSASYVGGDVRVCQKCNQVKPERTHHCKVCKRCILKYDHHCPWINQCVGLHNERYFVLFM